MDRYPAGGPSARMHAGMVGGWILALSLAAPLACGLDAPDDGGLALPGASSGQAPPTMSGGSSSSSGGGEQEQECPYTGPPPLDPTTLEACPSCPGGAHCVPTALVPPEQAAALAACDGDATCVPDLFIVTNGLFIPPGCVSIGEAEGRCLSVCIPDVADKAGALPQDTCDEHERCVPCFDPLTKEATGACDLSCDPGPKEPPSGLANCCSGRGSCVPASSAGSQADKLGQDTCPQDGGELLCAPDVFVNDPSWKPPACQTSLISSLFGAAYEQGACLPDCLPDVDNFLIQQDGCDEGFKCAPCNKPPFGESSGACAP